MPNWCQNTLTVEGQEKVIAKMMEKVKGEVMSHGRLEEQELSFNAIVPMPKELTEICHGAATDKDGKKMQNWRETPDGPVAVDEESLIKKYGSCNWYDWANRNWGTKWDASELEVERQHGLVCFRFTTAWGPPTQALEKLAAMFPHLKFVNQWREEGGQQGNDILKDA